MRVAGLLALGAALAAGRAAWPAAPRPHARPLAWAATAFVFALLASTALAVDVPSALLGSEHRQQGLLTLLALVALGWVASHASREGVERGLAAIAVASLPVAAYAITQHRGLDPLPWAQDTALRVTGPLGHPAFLAAYLMMAVPIVLGRLVAAWSDPRGPAVRAARLVAYAAILSVDVCAFVIAGSRGPWLGMGVGLTLFFLVLGLVEGRRWLALGSAGAALAGVLGLGLLNLPGGPLEALREGEGVGRLAHLLDAESGTVRGRVLIWRASLERAFSTQPLVFADGRQDGLAVLRPWVGFGPESFTAAVLPFYPAELAQIEKEHPIPDRAHNDLLDAAVGGGLLGLLAHVALVAAALGVGGARLGLGSPGRIGAVALGGGVAGLVLAWLLRGRALAAVGLGLGLVLGFGVLLVVGAFRPGGAAVHRGGEGAILAGLLAALAGHLVETQFGVATVTTRLLLAAILGWLVALGNEPVPEERAPSRTIATVLGLGGLLGLTVAYGFLRPGSGIESLLPVMLVLALAGAAVASGLARGGPSGRAGWVRAVVGSLLVAIGVAGALGFWRSDVLLAAARRLGDVGEAAPAEDLYKAAWRLAPYRDAIPAGAARVLVETARITVDEADRDALLSRADAYLEQASSRAPLAWTHAADRARLQLLWAGLTVEPPLRQRRLDQADRHYRATLRLHPHSAAVWNEWALLALVSGASAEARLRLERSLELDPRLDQTHRLLREVPPEPED